MDVYVGGEFDQQVFLTKLRKLIFDFIWNGRTQWLKQEKVMLTREKGGMGIPELHMLSKACLLRGTFNALEGSGLGGDMARFWLGLSLGLFTGERVTNSGPKSAYLPMYYKMAKDAMREIRGKETVSEVSNLKTNEIYSRMREKEEQRAGSNLVPEAWARIGKFWLDSRRSTLLWKIAHQIVPVRHKFFMWRKTSDGGCLVCRTPETVKHAFLSACQYRGSGLLWHTTLTSRDCATRRQWGTSWWLCHLGRGTSFS